MPAPVLPTTIAPGDSGHIAAHEEIHLFHNSYRKSDGSALYVPSDYFGYTDALAAKAGHILSAPPASSVIVNGEGYLYQDVSGLVRNKRKDSVGAVHDDVVAGATSGAVLAAVQVEAAILSLPNTPAGTFNDVVLMGQTVQISFVAQSILTECWLGIPPMTIQTADAASPLNFRVREPGVRPVLQATPFGKTQALGTAETFVSRYVATVPGQTYTWALQFAPPGSGTATFLWFGTLADEHALRLGAATA